MMTQQTHLTAEHRRLEEDRKREKNWKRWGPYLADRQWGTVREDYSADGDVWGYFPHDDARSRAYRWGEDGLLGWTDRECRLCFSLALWNGNDHILKERLFGLSNPEGNHGEDVKELYYHLDATPTYSYAKALYKYPQRAFPYDDLVKENRRRTKHEEEYELLDTGVFDEGRLFDIRVEYSKADDNDTLIRVTATNRGPQAHPLHLLPTLMFRNVWAWGCEHEGCVDRPLLEKVGPGVVLAEHETLKRFYWYFDDASDGTEPTLLFTQNETNVERLFQAANPTPHVKDAFHHRVIDGDEAAVSSGGRGTKAAAWYEMNVPAGGSVTLRLRLTGGLPGGSTGLCDPWEDYETIFSHRVVEADEYFDATLSGALRGEPREVARAAYAGLLWSKRFYLYIVQAWLAGDDDEPTPPPQRLEGRNHQWKHLFSRDLLSIPDSWEYPWFAAWDLAFHMLPLADLDPHDAKRQLARLLREWYMNPSGQLPAYEFDFGDVNPPVHAWACWRVYKIAAPRGERDRTFLASTFQKLLLNFTWWVNRKDPEGNGLFTGGFLGLDNIGVFDRSHPQLLNGGRLNQADATAWMAFYAHTMLAMALELAEEAAEYQDMASKFFEHFIAIADAMNELGGSGLWDEQDGFYYDSLLIDGHAEPLRVRSLVGLIPLIAVEVIEQRQLDRLAGFKKRTDWFLEHRGDLGKQITYLVHEGETDGDSEGGAGHEGGKYLLAIPSRERLVRVLGYMLDETEFLSPFGIRSLSKYHEGHPFAFDLNGEEHTVRYEPGESRSGMFGGNSNWRGPVWFPINYLLIEAMQRYHRFYGETLKVECPTGSGVMMTLEEVAWEIERRLTGLFRRDASGRRPAMAGECGGVAERAEGLGAEGAEGAEVGLHDHPLFHEYFHAETGRGLGASHQTGWTALVARCLADQSRREGGGDAGFV